MHAWCLALPTKCCAHVAVSALSLSMRVHPVDERVSALSQNMCVHTVDERVVLLA
jgi:hypothetical protein